MKTAATCPSTGIANSDHSSWAKYNTSNQLTSSTATGSVATFVYDGAGNILNDGVNLYAYDLDGRICAVTTVASGGAKTQYVYDAEGRRVAKGTIATWPAAGTTCSAPTAANGFSLSGGGAAIYLRGEHGDQDTELDGAGTWRHTNVFAGGGLTATYDTGTKATLSFNYSDWLGSKRVQSSFGGVAQNSWSSDPFGAYLKALGSGADATEHHFTGKERDSESGLDEFGARYYGSSLGRFMQPDWAGKPTAVPYANYGNPQSLNLYAYIENNPLYKPDLDGHGCPPDCSTGDPMLDFFGGAGNAFASDNLLGAGRVNETTASGKVGQAVGDIAAEVQGGAEMLFGGGVEIGGLALDATGVGAVLGVPANVVGAGVMLHGGVTAGDRLLESIQKFNLPFPERRGCNHRAYSTKQDSRQ